MVKTGMVVFLEGEEVGKEILVILICFFDFNFEVDV